MGIMVHAIIALLYHVSSPYPLLFFLFSSWGNSPFTPSISGLGSGPSPVAVSSTVIGGGVLDIPLLILAMICQICDQVFKAC